MYNRVKFKDHVVEHPLTFTETVNGDSSITLTPKPGTIYQQGTPQNATNFNNIDEALAHYAAAFDFLSTIYQAEMRDAQDRITTLEAQVAAMT